MKQCRDFHERKRLETEPHVGPSSEKCKSKVKNMSRHNLSCERFVLELTSEQPLNSFIHSSSE